MPGELMITPLPGQMIIATRAVDGKKPATIQMMCPDGWSKNINGSADKKDLYVLVRIPLSTVRSLEKMAHEEEDLQSVSSGEAGDSIQVEQKEP